MADSNDSQQHLQENDDDYEFHKMRLPYLQMIIIIVGVFMAVLDMSVVNVAIPNMEAELGATTDQIQWVLTGYMLTIGVLVPISGWMTEKVGPKKLFLFSMFMFTLGSILCGMSWNLSSIIFFRIIQALGGGFMMPVTMSMIFRMFPPSRRGMMMGVFGIAIMAAPAFGPALSGYLVQYASWRLIFYVNVPIGIVDIIVGLLIMHEFPHEAKNRLDIWGFGLSTVGFFSLLYGINNVTSHGWGSVLVMTSVSIGVVSLVTLVIVELRIKDPVINFRVLNNYMFSMSLLITSIINTALFVGIFLLPLYLQNIMGFSALRTGLFMTPAALASAVVMPISGRLFDRIGARPLGLLGLFVITIATYGFTGLTLSSSGAHIQWLYILRSVGMGMTMMPIMTAGMNTLPVSLTSQGTAMTNTVRQIASSLGTAVLTSYMTTKDKIHAVKLAGGVTQFSPQGQHMLNIQHMLQSMGTPPVLAHQEATLLVYGLIKQKSFVQGMDDTFFVATLLTGIAFVLVIFFASKAEREARERNRRKKSDAPVSQSDTRQITGETVPALE
ncbi:DHA2 family efflux MFS transporter permease subunit [Alicyclobacillus sp. SO9]|uniref:DHA2 family efflux MFS transporter permease subunit n=1 Tax=Alicyclobacillus sp. SO9 TaxID=2665646 RepID=UPI0018E70A97|nr:DHA2 family efflux MFS transporter permease subunit [Alicyclobacillus sp. SO9]QQE77143.1 DHA2 family efflux MFS transporter permease subunit [Alicyclobacillus sp. SO9]